MGRSSALKVLGRLVRGAVSGASDGELLRLVGAGVLECLAVDGPELPEAPLRVPVTVTRSSASKAKPGRAIPASAGGGPPPATRRRPRTVAVDSDGYVSGVVVGAAEVRAEGVRVASPRRPKYKRP